MKHTIQDIAKERLKRMQEHKGKSMPSKYSHEDMGEEEDEMSADVEEKTPAGKDMPHHKPGLGGDKDGIAVMIGIGKPMMHGKHPMHPAKPPHPMYAKHPGLGESIEDEEPVMGGKYGK